MIDATPTDTTSTTAEPGGPVAESGGTAPVMRHWGPDPAEGVRKYVEKMGQGYGIGYGYSQRMLKTFGHERLPDIIKNEPHKLAQITNRSDLNWRGLSSKWKSKTDEEHEAMMRMLSYRNISYAEAARICKRYGFRRGVSVVFEDPYQLSFDVDGIGFERADKIALEGGTGKGSEKRAQAALFHALHASTEDGDTYVPRRDWINKAEWLMGRGYGKQLASMIEQLISRGYVYEVLLPDEPGKRPRKPERVYYPMGLYRAEVRLARQIKKLAACKTPPPADVAAHLAAHEAANNIQLSDKQREIVRLVSENPVTIVTGGPGTGKTTAVRAVMGVFGERLSMPASLAAFAGCAAKRLREAAKAPALTIHKTLEYDPVHEVFLRDADNPLESDLVVLDEVSMIDTSLFDHALQAVRPGARLLLIGDVDQLPSIGPGAVLRDAIDSGVAPVVRLEHIFRQSKRSRIVTAASRIRSGLPPVPAVRINREMEVVERPEDPDARVPDGAQESDAEPLRDYIDLEIERPANLGPEEKFDVGKATCEAVVRLVKTIGKRYGIKPEDVQVLCPMRVRAAGADELNQALQAALNPQAPPVAMSAWSNGTPNPNTSSTVSQKPKLQIGSPRETASVGDKVMQLRNDYQKGLYNGDVGFIEAIDHKQVVVDFRDGMPARTYTPAGTADIKLAYASTVHKSQGQEFPCVVIVVLSHQSHMFSKNGRNLFYTAVTRGKKLVFVVHDKGAIEKALSPPRPRQTLLRQRLQGVPVRFRTGPAVPPEAATPTTPPT